MGWEWWIWNGPLLITVHTSVDIYLYLYVKRTDKENRTCLLTCTTNSHYSFLITTWKLTIIIIIIILTIRRLTAKAGYLWSQRNWGSCCTLKNNIKQINMRLGVIWSIPHKRTPSVAWRGHSRFHQEQHSRAKMVGNVFGKRHRSPGTWSPRTSQGLLLAPREIASPRIARTAPAEIPCTKAKPPFLG